jgi:hypothetical protein
MKKVEVKTLKAGLSFSEPVYIEGNNLLVPAGVAIRKKDIDRLNSWGIEMVETNGDPISPDQAKSDKPAPKGKESAAKAGSSAAESSVSNGKAPAEASKKNQSPISLSEVQGNKGAYRMYMDLIERLDQVFSSVAT